MWTTDTQTETRIFMITTDMNSNTLSEFSWDTSEPDPETITLKTGIHHFEMDVVTDAESIIVSNTVNISQQIYVNSSIGTSATKKIVYNYEYEEKANEEKRNIYLLRKEYLFEFISEFDSLMNTSI